MNSNSKPPKFVPEDAAHVSYLVWRDRFLAKFADSDDTRDAIRLMKVGRVVVDRWMAEEHARTPGQPLDEAATDELWDQYTERSLREFSTETEQIFARAVSSTKLRDLVAQFGSGFKPIAGITNAINWLFMTAWTGFISAIGIIAFGLLFVWALPSVTNAIRAAVDDSLPKNAQSEKGIPENGSLPDLDARRK